VTVFNQIIYLSARLKTEFDGGFFLSTGPRLFLSCPMDADAVPTWFTDLWNYSIVPYLLEAVREGIQVSIYSLMSYVFSNLQQRIFVVFYLSNYAWQIARVSTQQLIVSDIR
jgi:hypothetical protein